MMHGPINIKLAESFVVTSNEYGYLHTFVGFSGSLLTAVLTLILLTWRIG